MDPDATLALLLDAITDGDLTTVGEHYQALAQWMATGGFPPRDPRP